MTVYDFVCEYKHDYECSYDHDRWKLTMNHVHWRSLHDSEQSCHDNSKALECTLCMLTSDILMQIWFAISEGELPHFPAFSPSISGGESELPQFPLLNKASEAGTESAPVSISTITSINISVIPMLNKSAEKKQKKRQDQSGHWKKSRNRVNSVFWDSVFVFALLFVFVFGWSIAQGENELKSKVLSNINTAFLFIFLLTKVLLSSG